jgi:ABC-2 type transport system permease protein
MGVAFAWRMSSTRGFHGVMNVLMLPLWLLSGSVFPVGGAHPVLRILMQLNPVTYVMNALREALAHGTAPGLDLAVTVGFAAALVAVSLRIIRNAPAPAS